MPNNTFVATTSLEINITDVNERRPTLAAAPLLYTSVVEGEVPSSTLTLLSGSGAAASFQPRDADRTSVYAFRLANATKDGVAVAPATLASTFAVDPARGLPRLLQALDREQGATWRLRVELYDPDFPAVGGPLQTVVVVVIDVNDNAPVFTRSSYTYSVSRDAAVGTTMLSPSLAVTDPDQDGSATFRLVSGNTDSAFTIGRSSGTLLLASKPALQTYSLNISFTDGVFTIYTRATINVQPGPCDGISCPASACFTNGTCVAGQCIPGSLLSKPECQPTCSCPQDTINGITW